MRLSEGTASRSPLTFQIYPQGKHGNRRATRLKAEAIPFPKHALNNFCYTHTCTRLTHAPVSSPNLSTPFSARLAFSQCPRIQNQTSPGEFTNLHAMSQVRTLRARRSVSPQNCRPLLSFLLKFPHRNVTSGSLLTPTAYVAPGHRGPRTSPPLFPSPAAGRGRTPGCRGSCRPTPPHTQEAIACHTSVSRT